MKPNLLTCRMLVDVDPIDLSLQPPLDTHDLASLGVISGDGQKLSAGRLQPSLAAAPACLIEAN